MFKLFAIVFLSWAAAVQAADLPAEVAAILPTPRGHTVAFFDNDKNIFIMGGNDEFNVHHDVLKYDVTRYGHVEEAGYFPTGITQGALGVDALGNFFYLGGDNGNNKSEITWQLTGLFPRPLMVGQFEELNKLSCSASDGLGNVFLIGGSVGTMETKRNIVKYDTTTNTATVVAQLPIGMHGTACAWVEDSIYIFGGLTTNFQYSTDIIKFTPATNQLNVLDMTFGSEGILHASAVTVGSFVYIVGGMSPNGEVHHVTKFDPFTTTLVEFNLPTHNTMFAGISTVHVPDTNRIYVIGGYTFENNKMKSLDEVFYIQLDYLN